MQKWIVYLFVCFHAYISEPILINISIEIDKMGPKTAIGSIFANIYFNAN